MTEPDYDPQADISGSFETALRVKRERGDKHYRVESPIKREASSLSLSSNLSSPR